MPILNYSTEISAERTIAEITKILVRQGATKITTDYKNGMPSAVTFCLDIATSEMTPQGRRYNTPMKMGFVLPANYEGVLRAMEKDAKVPRRSCTKEQAMRVSWRIVKTWIEAQCAIVEAGLAEMAEIFLPYAVTKSGMTLYESFKTGSTKLLN